MCRRFARNFTDDEREKEEGYLSRRIESSIRLHFLEQGRERVFFATRFVCFIWFDLENIWKYRKCREKVDV